MGFFKPGWLSENSGRAIRAVRKVADLQTLYEIVCTAPLPDARRAAIERMTDENLLFKTAGNDNLEQHIYWGWVWEDIRVLADLAKHGRTFTVRVDAARQIRENPAMTEDIARNGEYFDARLSPWRPFMGCHPTLKSC